MKIITANINGIRSATQKGFWDWFHAQEADILCLQELKAHEQQIPEAAKSHAYHRHCHFAEKPGYSGVALYCKQKPNEVFIGLASIDPDTDWQDMDTQGRFIQADFDGFSIINAYFPSGSSSPARQAAKMSFLERLLPLIERQIRLGKQLILCGDINIAHQNQDIKNWKSNQKNSGFLPEERAWMNTLTQENLLIDAFRRLYPEKEQYTWWSNRGKARENNVGWRIDYHLCSPEIAQKFSCIDVYTKQQFSDHAPVIATLDL